MPMTPATALAAALAFAGKTLQGHYFPKVSSDRYGNRGKYIPAGPNKNIKPHNR